MMDIARPRPIALRIAPRLAVAVGAVAIAAGGAWGVRSLRAGTAPTFTVDRASIVTDVVRRGAFVRAIGASGTLATRRIALVSAPAEGTIAALYVHPGSEVAAGTTIALLSNPAVDAEIADARAAIVTALADLASTRQQTITAELERKQAVRATQAERSEDADQAKAQTDLHTQGLIGEIAYRQAVTKFAEATDRERLQGAELASTIADGRAKIASSEAHVVQLRGVLARKLADRDALVVRSGADGIVQSVTAQLGAHVTLGSECARVADRRDLQAMLDVVESDARNVVVGLPVAVTTASGIARGSVVRIDPAATGGTVRVAVDLTQTPTAARIDEHVQAQIELQRIADAVSIVRPAGVADDGAGTVFRLIGPDRAERVAVTFGRGSSDRVVVRSGLHPGDRVIVSDMSAAADHPFVTLR